MLGVSQSLVQRRIVEWGWTRNEELPPLEVARPLSPPVPKFRFVDDETDEEPLTEMTPVPAGDLTGRLRRLVEREIARLEARPSSPDVTRALASLARIIVQLKGDGPEPTDRTTSEAEPFDDRDIHQFRIDLARKLDGVRLYWEDKKYKELADNPPFSVGPWGG